MLEAEKRHALYLRSFGTAGVDPATLSSGALETGLEIRANEFVFGSASEPDSTRVRRPSTGRLVLRREASCRGHLVRVDQTLVVDKGSDVIAVPRREAQTWHELRDAACASNASTVHEVLGVPSPRQPNVGSNAALFWIEQHRAELARLERGELKQQIP
jgi:hypothetical protein